MPNTMLASDERSSMTVGSAIATSLDSEQAWKPQQELDTFLRIGLMQNITHFEM